MSGKRNKRNARKAPAGFSAHELLFTLKGAEVMALQKAVRGYRLLVETLPEELDGRMEMLAFLHTLSQNLQHILLRPDEQLPAPFSIREISVANDAMQVYLTAASSFTEIALRTAPLEERHITALLLPLQQRLQAIVSRVEPKWRYSFVAAKPSLN
jgi:hypothetical protein